MPLVRRPLCEIRSANLSKLQGEQKDNYLRSLWKAGFDVLAPPEPPKPKPRRRTEEQALAELPCVHRGGKIGEHVCGPCQGKRVDTIFGCSLHTACTVRFVPGLEWEGTKARCCATCNDQSAPESELPGVGGKERLDLVGGHVESPQEVPLTPTAGSERPLEDDAMRGLHARDGAPHHEGKEDLREGDERKRPLEFPDRRTTTHS